MESYQVTRRVRVDRQKWEGISLINCQKGSIIIVVYFTPSLAPRRFFSLLSDNIFG